MKIKDILQKLNTFAPETLAEEWDNVGLMLGSADNECSGIVVTLDLTKDVAMRAVDNGCNLIVTHHPFIFHAIDRIDLATAKGGSIAYLLKNGITVYSAHTNLDKAEGGVCWDLAKMLGGRNLTLDGIGICFDIEKSSLKEFAKRVADVLGDRSVKLIGDADNSIQRIYLVSGSGADTESYLRAKQCADVFVTGDMKHHFYIDACGDDFPLIEYSHFHSEIVVENIFSRLFADCGVKIIKGNQKCPFRILEEL